MFIDVDLVNKPVSYERYETLSVDLPCMFLGFNVRNQYDEQRLKIPDCYEPKRILQLYYDIQTNIVVHKFLYGVVLKPRPLGDRLINILDHYTEPNTLLNEDLYTHIIKKMGYNYDQMNKSWGIGLYPLDLAFFKHLTYYSKIKLVDFIDIKNFQSFSPINVYILGNSRRYHSDASAKILKQAYIEKR